MTTTIITNVRVFNGKTMEEDKQIVIEGDKISRVLNQDASIAPIDEAVFVNGAGYTLLPGMFDAHVHTSIAGLQDALKFGVTTELEMMGGFTKCGREAQLKGKTGIADVFSAGMGLTAPKGHPDELIPDQDGIPDFVLKEMETMTEEERTAFIKAHEAEHDHGEMVALDSPENARLFVQKQVAEGADYIKIMIEEGSFLAAPGLPILSDEILRAGVDEAHRLNKLVLAHTLTAEAAKKAVELGVDGLAHLFIDRPTWIAELVAMIKANDVFVIPTLVLNGSICGNITKEISQDPRVVGKLSDEWVETLRASFNTAPYLDFQACLDNTQDLFQAGVPILAGTDVSVPYPSLGGLAHGASVHHELQLLVAAGLTNTEALMQRSKIFYFIHFLVLRLILCDKAGMF